jgi:hypothetical protein
MERTGSNDPANAVVVLKLKATYQQLRKIA